MNEQLKRELNKTYLILSSEDADYTESYELEMILKNSPEMILPLHVLRVDGTAKLYYDISAKQKLSVCAERVKLTEDTVRNLFQAVEQLLKEVKDYLLDMESIVLNLEHIYTKEGRFYFCYCPWEKKEVLTSFREMLEEILGNLDYHDTGGVALSYHLYQSACKGNLQIAEILEEHAKKEETDPDLEDAYDYDACFSENLEMSPDFELESMQKKSKTVQKEGILKHILRFFLKKEKKEEFQNKEELVPHEEIYQGFFSEQNSAMAYTELLETKSANTVLLDNMPIGRWKLRPLLPGFEEFNITGDSFLVGKKRDSVDGFIGRDTISRIHSRLYIRQERLFIADANSTNGTFVNGIPIEPGEDVEIFPGDRILFADVGYECYNSL